MAKRKKESYVNKPPYYYHVTDEIFHFDKECPLNNWPNNGWEISSLLPQHKVPCSKCRKLEKKIETKLRKKIERDKAIKG